MGSCSLKLNFIQSSINSSNSSILVLPYFNINKSTISLTLCFSIVSNLAITCSPRYFAKPSISLLTFNNSITSWNLTASLTFLFISIHTSNAFRYASNFISLLQLGTWAHTHTHTHKHTHAHILTITQKHTYT